MTMYISLKAFLVSTFTRIRAPKGVRFIPDLLDLLDGYNHESAPAIMPRIWEHILAGTGILTRCPSPTLHRLGLGPTNPGMTIIAQETLLFRWAGFSPALWLLIPAFSLPHAPPDLTIRLQRREERSSTTTHCCAIHIFGSMFSPVTFSAQGLLTSELLRTL